jgi:hypothetical protein
MIGWSPFRCKLYQILVSTQALLVWSMNFHTSNYFDPMVSFLDLMTSDCNSEDRIGYTLFWAASTPIYSVNRPPRFHLGLTDGPDHLLSLCITWLAWPSCRATPVQLHRYMYNSCLHLCLKALIFLFIGYLYICRVNSRYILELILF